MVVPLLSHFSEAGATKAMKFQTELLALSFRSLSASHNINVGLFASSNLVAKGCDDIPGGEGFEGKVIVASVGQPVTIILSTAFIR